MRIYGIISLVSVMAASMAVAQASLPADGVSFVQKPRAVDAVVNTNAPLKADAEALAALVADEKALLAEAKEVTIKITEVSYPLRGYRERVMAQDKDLQAINQQIRVKQAELEAKLNEKYPDIAAKTKERDELTRKYSDVSSKLRDVRKKMDDLQAVSRKDVTDSKGSK